MVDAQTTVRRLIQNCARKMQGDTFCVARVTAVRVLLVATQIVFFNSSLAVCIKNHGNTLNLWSSLIHNYPFLGTYP